MRGAGRGQGRTRLNFQRPRQVGLTIIFGLGLGLLLVELLLRVVPAVLPPEIQPQVAQKLWLLTHVGLPQFVAEYRRLWEMDSYLGSRMRPGLDTIIHGNPEYPAWPIKTDALGLGPAGFRDTLPDRRPYALVLGDSFGFGVGVAQDEVWLEVLERETGRPFLNLSQVGASSLQEARIYDRYGRAFPVKVVFWMFFQNDLKENLRFAQWLDPAANIPQAEANAGQLCRGPVYRALKRFSIAYELVIYWRRWCEYAAIPPTPTYQNEVLSLTFCLDHDICDLQVQARMLFVGWPLTRAALAQTQALVEQNGAELIIIIVPSKEQVYRDRFQQVALLPADYNIDQLVQPLLDDCAQVQLHCIDLTEPFRDQARQGQQLYFPVDIHWNAAGHRLVAQVVKRYLSETGRLP